MVHHCHDIPCQWIERASSGMHRFAALLSFLAGAGLLTRLGTVAVHAQTNRAPMPLASDLVIGKASGPDQYTFGLLSEIAEDAQGFIYALDPLYARIQVYDSIGRYRATIGAKGWGPGEFQAPESFVLSRERLVVRDVRKGLYFILESSGKLSATLPAQLEGSVRRKLRVDTLGHLFDLRDNLRDPHGPRLAVFDLINLGAPADTVQLPPIPLDTFWIRGIGEGQGFSAVIPQPLMAQFYWTVLPDGAVVYALGSQYTLTILRHGQGPQTIERPGSI